MIIEEKMKNIVSTLRRQNTDPLYIRSSLKEYLQSYVLNFIFSEGEYKDSYIFTGGTCLRKVYGINRLSEDLDFDVKEPIDPEKLRKGLEDCFVKKYMFQDFSTSVKQQGRQVLLKFGVLNKLGLAGPTESPLLYIKLDINNMESDIYGVDVKLLNDFDFSYISKSYDISTLMSGKILAILQRTRLWGTENQETIKGRDYFDLLWFLERDVKPDLERINDIFKKQGTGGNVSAESLGQMLDAKVELAVTKFKDDFKRDLLPFIDNPAVLGDYVDYYRENYQKLRGNL